MPANLIFHKGDTLALYGVGNNALRLAGGNFSAESCFDSFQIVTVSKFENLKTESACLDS